MNPPPSLAPHDGNPHCLVIQGRAGTTAGQRVTLRLGDTILLGRSRHCDFSLKKSPAFLRDRDGERERIRATLSYRATSRRHVRVTYVAPDVAEIENLSRNGTIVDGRRVNLVRVGDLRRRAHEVRLGRLGDIVVLAAAGLPVDAA